VSQRTRSVASRSRRFRGHDDPAGIAVPVSVEGIGVVAVAGAPALIDWPDSVRVVGSQPSLWLAEPDPEPVAAVQGPGVVRLGPEALVVGGELALGRETGQSFALMGLMALVLTLFVGLGLLAVRMLV